MEICLQGLLVISLFCLLQLRNGCAILSLFPFMMLCNLILCLVSLGPYGTSQ